MHRYFLILLTLLLLPPAAVAADTSDATPLMLLGETEPVTTVASRRPESAVSAPAMVRVVDREQIELYGYRTLAELLTDQVGFTVAMAGRGSVSYLRGLRDAVLFLYDGVPMTTDVTKSFAPLDREVSLAAVERVEIVRGAGSVLWGADAFAGVVNIVPRRGLQADSAARVQVGTDDLRGAHLRWASKQPNWDAFLSFSGSQKSYHLSDLSIDHPLQPSELDPSTYAEVVGTFAVGDWLHLSGRWSDYERNYSMQNSNRTIRWAGIKEAPFNYLKGSLSHSIGASHYSLAGYYQTTDYSILDADVERHQHNQVSHLELLWDRRVLARGLLTAGMSWRRNAVDGALVRDGFLPDFLTSDENFFVPSIQQADFSSRLVSFFGQFRYLWRGTEYWVGLRSDDHSQYQRTLSYSLGFYRPLGERFHLKVAFGTAYRSPYSSQLFDDKQLDPESVQTLSAQLRWNAGNRSSLELTLFHSQLNDSRAEDPYGGLSLPADRRIYGAELAGEARLSPHLRVFGGFALHEGGGNNEQYRIVEFSFLRPDGSRVNQYEEWSQPFEQAGDWQARLGLIWSFADRHSIVLAGRLEGDHPYSYEKNAVSGAYHSPVLVDLNYRRPGVFSGHDRFNLRITNLLDQNYLRPDVYGPVEGEPLQLSLFWEYRF